MLNFFASILSVFGLGAANTGSQACFHVFWDEVECPKSLLK